MAKFICMGCLMHVAYLLHNECEKKTNTISFYWDALSNENKPRDTYTRPEGRMCAFGTSFPMRKWYW